MFRYFLVLLVALASRAAYAQSFCSASFASFTPALSKVTTQGMPAPGAVVYSGSVNFIIACAGKTPPNPTDRYSVNVGTTPQNLGMSGLKIVLTGMPTWTTLNGYIPGSSIPPAPCSSRIAGGPTVTGTASYEDLTIYAAGGACGIQVRAPVKIVADGTYPSGALAVSFSKNAFPSNTTAIPVVDNYTCSPSMTTTNVPLPPVSTTALATAGQTAAPQRFNLQFQGCTPNGGKTGNGFTMTETWSYAPAGPGNAIANSAASPARNVYVQLLDARRNPIANQGTTSIDVPQGGGSLAQPFYAQYVSTGGAGAGNVTGVATLTLSYN